MERPLNNYKKGDIVILQMQFSDQSNSKRRPGLIIATPPGNDVIILLITSKKQHTPESARITQKDFTKGTLPHTSYVKTKFITTTEKKTSS